MPDLVEGGLTIAREIGLGMATGGVSALRTATTIGLMAKTGFLTAVAMRGASEGMTHSIDAYNDFKQGNYLSGAINVFMAGASFLEARAGLGGLKNLGSMHFPAPRAVNGAADAISAFLRTKCFARGTLVRTDQGLREIGNIQPGEQVLSYDFENGEWTYRTVTERIDNIYEGAVVTVETDDCRIEATIHHPFWVVKGHELEHRSTPRELAVDEDQNLSLEGRWVNSHELLAGDTIVGQDGKLLVVRGVSQRLEAEFPVSNLTIAGLHNYTVGTASILVHNTAICDAGQAALRDMLHSGAATFDEIARSVRGFTNADEVLRSLAASAGKTIHGNSLASTKTTYLYRLLDKAGNFLKWGITNDLNKRYTQSFMRDKIIERVAEGSRFDMATLERSLVERMPGILNFEPWAGSRLGGLP